jgi:CBS domain-containing protein
VKHVKAVNNNFKKAEMSLVSDIINAREYLACHPNDKVSNILKMMQGHHIGAAAVMDKESHMIGMVTEREILRRLFQIDLKTPQQKKFANHPKDIMDLVVEDVMIEEPLCLAADATIEEAMSIMTKHTFRFMPVLENDKENDSKITGIICINELHTHIREKNIREIETKDALLNYFMNYGQYGGGQKANIV